MHQMKLTCEALRGEIKWRSIKRSFTLFEPRKDGWVYDDLKALRLRKLFTMISLVCIA